MSVRLVAAPDQRPADWQLRCDLCGRFVSLDLPPVTVCLDGDGIVVCRINGHVCLRCRGDLP